MIGSILLLIGGIIIGFIGLALLGAAKTSIHEIQGFILIAAAVIAGSAAFIVSYLGLVIKELKKQGKVPPIGIGSANDANSRLLVEQEKTNELLTNFLDRLE